jgi:hypothetical protein
MSRQVVYASGLECAHVLSFKGQQVRLAYTYIHTHAYIHTYITANPMHVHVLIVVDCMH